MTTPINLPPLHLKLPDLEAGEIDGRTPDPQFHNPDGLPTAGDPPWRFLVQGEKLVEGDQGWHCMDIDDHSFQAVSYEEPLLAVTYRTRRPLSTQGQGLEETLSTKGGDDLPTGYMIVPFSEVEKSIPEGAICKHPLSTWRLSMRAGANPEYLYAIPIKGGDTPSTPTQNVSVQKQDSESTYSAANSTGASNAAAEESNPPGSPQPLEWRAEEEHGNCPNCGAQKHEARCWNCFHTPKTIEERTEEYKAFKAAQSPPSQTGGEGRERLPALEAPGYHEWRSAREFEDQGSRREALIRFAYREGYYAAKAAPAPTQPEGPSAGEMELNLPKFYFVFDVESIGLHGEPFAVGWTVVNTYGDEKDSGRLAIKRELSHGDDDDREWCEQNIPHIPVTHLTLAAMLSDFWTYWTHWKEQGAVMCAECLWPVEAKFLAMCIGVEYPKSKWSGPYPFHEVASIMMAAGMDPMAKYDRLPNELPTHEPLADARQSARLLLQSLGKIESLRAAVAAAMKGEGK